WDNQLIDDVGYNLSIENSPLVIGDTLWFANSGGLVQGWDLSGLVNGVKPHRTFRYWVGDDVDATLVPDAEGMLYVAVEYERETDRSHELGQVIKLDPSRPDDPLVWALEARSEAPSGVWATPAVHRDLLLVATNDGEVLGVDRADGSVRWTVTLPRPVWSSPTVVDDVLIIGDCAWAGRVLAFDVSDTTVQPPLLWEVPTGGCVEASAAVWNGTVYIGSRDGFLYALRDPW
ncbi:MAG: PQQ-like beta-propeller repeat protein, partial [Acidimicrobiales bacterium]|nr:PQQ-like beta-propeller repeat protein [Acidimicrobiales bacterium]